MSTPSAEGLCRGSWRLRASCGGNSHFRNVAVASGVGPGGSPHTHGTGDPEGGPEQEAHGLILSGRFWS